MHQFDSTLDRVVVTDNERLWAASAHVAALLLAFLTSWLVGIAGLVGAGAVYLLKRDASQFIAAHAREAMNFNLTMFLYAAAAVAIAVVLVGATVLTLGLGILVTGPAGVLLGLAAAAIAMLWLVCSVIAAVKAWNGETYRYPLTLRLFG